MQNIQELLRESYAREEAAVELARRSGCPWWMCRNALSGDRPYTLMDALLTPEAHRRIAERMR